MRALLLATLLAAPMLVLAKQPLTPPPRPRVYDEPVVVATKQDNRVANAVAAAALVGAVVLIYKRETEQRSTAVTVAAQPQAAVVKVEFRF